MRSLALIASFALGCASVPPRAEQHPPEPARRQRSDVGTCVGPNPEFPLWPEARRKASQHNAYVAREIAPRPFTSGEDATLAEVARALGDAPNPTPDVAALRWRRARIFLSARRWPEAAIALHELAFEHAGTDAGLDAAIPYLEALDVLGSRASPPRSSCYDDMASDVPRLLELYCGPETRQWSPPCRTLSQIQVDLWRLKS